MLVFLVTAGHKYTTAGLLTEDAKRVGLRVATIDYDTAFSRLDMPLGTYLFTDIERMYPWELRLASRLYANLKESGCTAYNDPARAMNKYQLLRALRKAGVNGFTTYRADDLVRPQRFPVFIRTEYDHGSLIHDLIPDAESLSKVLRKLVGMGIPLRGLLITEFCSEEFAPGRFRRFGVYKIGDRFVPENMVISNEWAVKDTMKDPENENAPLHRLEMDFVVGNPFESFARNAFAIGNIEYGRADIGIVDGMPQIYEINTAPQFKVIDYGKIAATRQEAVKLSWKCRLGAFFALDAHRDVADAVVPITDPWLEENRKRQVKAKSLLPSVRP